ncbi:B3/4 domain-containing protein [Cupriavidus taiwanensis]|uniref:B3/B4 domain-containing protein n=1 Tax=Cupriavidus taiwanensis TaxID=164546 RepID=UPI0039C02F37
MSVLMPSLDPAISVLAPSFKAISITVEAAGVANPRIGTDALDRASRSIAVAGAEWADDHLQEWAEVFRSFGAKPQRTPCSAEALRKRALRDGRLPSIDPVVDLYNAISIKYAVPVGGENLAAYVGVPKLTLADGTEPFDTMKDGAPAQESPEPGEVIWRDDEGVTCRRWNWRQGVRTRLSADATQMWFILESLSAMPLGALHEAGDRLAEGLQLLMHKAKIEKRLIGFGL